MTDSEKRYKSGTLCWECTRLDCSWIRDTIPVQGWKAVKTEVGHSKKGRWYGFRSYHVIECPEFKGKEPKHD